MAKAGEIVHSIFIGTGSLHDTACTLCHCCRIDRVVKIRKKKVIRKKEHLCLQQLTSYQRISRGNGVQRQFETKAPFPNLMRQNVWRANSLLHQTLLVKYCCGDLRRVVARSTTSRMFCNSPLATVSCSCTGDCTVVYSIEEDCHPAHYFDYRCWN